MRKITLCIAVFLFFSKTLTAQKENQFIYKGNEAYKEQKFDKAITAYQKALQQSPRNSTAAFNLGNAMYRTKKNEEAARYFDAAIDNSTDIKKQGDGWYNKGVMLTAEKKLQESIDAYKTTLRLNPMDTLARENLQRALNELKKQQQQQKKDQQQNKKQEQKKQQSKLTKQQVMQLLQAMQEQERMLQQKMQKSKVPVPGQPDKDW
ncbi:MAG: tetratricopeptide repeat protein [Chitinophagaceae bacterium]|nr:tetratricopeptide repeat protein [Chitinophagaceae bacterium]